MHENLVIVESPAKAKTIEKFLGKDYKVCSSYGHIRDLSKKGLGIDIENNFNPSYQVADEKKKLVAELNKMAKDSKTVWLASDEDREGEAIAWHLTQVLDLPVEQTKRIVFHEITKNAIVAAIENPRAVNMDLVNAQQARRVLDRLVGFELSPVLWKKVKPSLSAGRVQSVAVRLLVEREREIIAFKAVAYYKVTAQFYLADSPKQTLFKADLDKKFETKAEAVSFLEKCRASKGVDFNVVAVEKKTAERNPSPPFTTSTLQQESSRKFGMSVSQTMSVAQKLYEAGYITYMRTDSVNLSQQALALSKEEIIKLYGENYHQYRTYKTKSKGAQEAHEAIRPSYLNRSEIDGTAQEKKLYELIWKRTIASQMSAAQLDKTIVTIAVGNLTEKFIATGEVTKFDGFLKLYSESVEDDVEANDSHALPAMEKGNKLVAEQIMAAERFTQQPYRYSEASLVKRMEELGIGRPSTYAPTITTIINRGYVIKQNKDGVERKSEQIVLTGDNIVEKILTETVGKEKAKLTPTDIGMVVNDYLSKHFSAILDYNFTAKVEKEFDEIAEGKKGWTKMLEDFYGVFHDSVNVALETQTTHANGVRVLGIDPVSGNEVSARIGRYGPIAQIEAAAEGEKPKYASLKKEQLIETITLEEALALFALPRILGEINGEEVVVGIGKFGPYIRHAKKFVSLDKTDDPYTVVLERAAELIAQKEEQNKKSKEPIKTFEEEPEMLILNGMYGPYIAYKKKNYRIPKSKDPKEITLEECRTIIEKSKK